LDDRSPKIPPDPAAIRLQVRILVRVRKDALILRWTVTTVIIGVYAVFLAFWNKPITEQVRPLVTALFSASAALLAAASIYVPFKLLDDARLQAYLADEIDAHRWALRMRFDGPQTDVFVALPPPAQRLLSLTLLCERPFMLSLALTHGVALLGLCYGMIAGTVIEGAPFFLGAIALNCWHYPRLNKLFERRRKFVSPGEDTQALQLLEQLQQRNAAQEGPQQPEPSPPPPPPPPPPQSRPRTQPRLRRASRPQRPAKS
jgi:hypothetical protein